MLEEERLVGVLDRVGLLTDALGQGGQPDGLSAEPSAQRVQDGPVHLVQAELVHPEQRQPFDRREARDAAVAPNLDEVADPPQQAVGDPWRAPGPFADAGRALVVDD